MTLRSLALKLALLAATSVAATTALDARTLKWSRSGDSLTLDPHAQNEGPTAAVAHQMYEPLATRSVDGKLVPALATSWRILPDNPLVWEFKLRQGVKFHDGAPFTADDVVFSLNRAMSPTSDFKGLWTSVDTVTKVDDFKGLNARNPWMAGLVLCIMASLAGIPPFLGFWTKLAVLGAAVKGDMLWLALVGVICAVIGAYYYLRVIKVMYFDEPVGEPLPANNDRVLGTVLGVNALALLALGLAWSPIMAWCQRAFAGLA